MDRRVETLRELEPGFAFVGRQVHFDVGGDDFYLDLPFFQVEQLHDVATELRTGKFKSEHIGQPQFSIALVEDRLRREARAPTVGIFVCGNRKDHTVRYALNQVGSPMAVATYTYDLLLFGERTALPSESELIKALDWTQETALQD